MTGGLWLRGTGGGMPSALRGADRSGRRRENEPSRGSWNRRITSIGGLKTYNETFDDFRIEILQKIRQEELDRKKVEERRRLERGLRDSVVRVKRDEAVEQVMMMIVTMVISDLNIVLYNPPV